MIQNMLATMLHMAGRQPARQATIQQKYRAVQLVRRKPAFSAAFPVSKRHWSSVNLPSGRAHSGRKTFCCQAIWPEWCVTPEDRLSYSARVGNWPEVTKQLAAGAPVDAGCDSGEGTPLHYAVEAGETDIVKMLLECGADPNAEGMWGPPLATALFYQMWDPIPEDEIKWGIVEVLLDAGAKPNPGDIYDPEHFPGFSLLHVAALKNADHIIDFLCERGADVEDVDRWDELAQTPLHVAAQNGNVEAAEVLLDWGADANRIVGTYCSPLKSKPVQPPSGDTPLHLLTSGFGSGCVYGARNPEGRAEVARLLLAAGADIHAKDSEGRTAYEATWGVHLHDNEEVRAVLLSAMQQQPQ